MGLKTIIQYADSSFNEMMGCDGCELWVPSANIKECYAGTMTAVYAGRKGWPERFDKPKIFPERVSRIKGWSDFTGKERPHKPWLNGMPRVIFLNDMGDAWTESLSIDWMHPNWDLYEKMPHIFLLLTKRPKRMVKSFVQYGRIPKNFVLGTSVTAKANIPRAMALLSIGDHFPDANLWISAEPLREELHHLPLQTNRAQIGTVATGGESGAQAKPTHPDAYRYLRDLSERSGTKLFFKQHGKYRHISQGHAENAKRTIQYDGEDYYEIGNKKSGRELDGALYSELGWFK